MSATARRIGHRLENEVNVNGRHVITTDEPEWIGGEDRGPAPHELLPAALAACVATMVEMHAGRRDLPLDDLAVHVDYDHEDAPRRFVVTIELGGDIPPDQIECLRRVAQTCPVRRALEDSCSFEERVQVRGSEPGVSLAVV